MIYDNLYWFQAIILPVNLNINKSGFYYLFPTVKIESKYLFVFHFADTAMK